MRTLVALVAILAVGCVTRDVSALDPTETTQVEKQIPVGMNRDVDILFVIDDSGSMSEEQAALITSFPRFIEILGGIVGDLPNVHIGVVSTDVGVGGYVQGGCTGAGDDGRLQNTPRVVGCAPPAGAFLEDVGREDGSRQRNYTGELKDAFSCIAQLGTTGCGFEQPLESMRRALDGSDPFNAGFLRPSAYLAVIFLTDEDDCSASDPSLFDPYATGLGAPALRCPLAGLDCCQGGDCAPVPIPEAPAAYDVCTPHLGGYLEAPSAYADFLLGLKPGRPDLILVSAIVAPTTPVAFANNPVTDALELSPSCTHPDPLHPTNHTYDQLAFPPVRIASLLGLFPATQTSSVTICANDLGPGIDMIANKLVERMVDTCLVGAINTEDINPLAVGLQLDCHIAEIAPDGTETTLRRCEMQDDTTPVAGQALPCWWAHVDAGCAEHETSLILSIERESDPPDGTTIKAYCSGMDE
jgi:hypothetical protein